MSRLFNALQEAARRRTPSTPVDFIWKELGVNGGDFEKARAEAEDQATQDHTNHVVEDIDSATLPEKSDIATQVLSPTFDGVPEKILLDKQARLIPHTNDSSVVERYRMLRTKILQERERKPFRSLVIASANPLEGKTVTALNLGLVFAAMPGMKVVLVDADMRKGTLSDWTGIDRDRPGLSNVLEGTARLEDVVLKSESLSLCVLPRGNVVAGDVHLSQFGSCMRQLSNYFDLVLVDTPPTNLLTDVQIIAASCDAILLVARAFSTANKSIEEAAEKLQPFRLIGTVLNAGTPVRSKKYKGYY